MSPAAKWICRKEIAWLIGRSVSSVARSETALGLADLKVKLNKRATLYPRAETLAQLRAKKLI